MIADPARDFIYLYEDWGPDFVSTVAANYGDEPARLLARVRFHYIVTQIEWTLSMLAEQRDADVESGLQSLRFELLESRAWPERQ